MKGRRYKIITPMIRKILDVRIEGGGELLVTFGVGFSRKGPELSNSFSHVEIAHTRLG